MDYKPTYRDLFSFNCVGWTLLFFSQAMTILTYLSILGLNIWFYWDDTIAMSHFGLFYMQGDGSRLYYWDSDCSSLFLGVCKDLEVGGKTTFSLLFITLVLSIVNAGCLATFKLGSAFWYKRWMLLSATLWQGLLLTILAIWWTAGLRPKLEALISYGTFGLDRSLLYAWLWPGFIYAIWIPLAAKISFHVEPAPGEAGIALVEGDPGASSEGPRSPGSPSTAPALGVAFPLSSTSALRVDGDEKYPAPSPAASDASPAPTDAPAPRRPPPPKSKPNVKKWKKEYDDNYKEYYYVNIKTGESQWDKPEDFVE